MPSNVSLIEEIRQQKQREKSADRDALLNLLRFLPGEKVHYARELIQNANDAHSHTVTFTFTENALIVQNDGDPFTADDVRVVCSAGQSHKLRKIGFFGVGFKSVFEITENPQVVSGEFNFSIRDFIYPEVREDPPTEVTLVSDRGATFVLRYGKATPPELWEALWSLDPRFLLFLDDVQKVVVNGSGIGRQDWILQRADEPDDVVVLQDTRTGSGERWVVFKADLEVPVGLQRPGMETPSTEVVIAFAPGHPELARAQPVYCYLPTRKTANLPFLVQADFTPTLGRENIKEDAWNAWLLRELGGVAARAIASLKSTVGFEERLCDYIPSLLDTSDDQVHLTIREMHRILRATAFVKGVGDTWLRPDRAILAPGDLQNVLTPNDIVKSRARRMRFALPIYDIHAESILGELGAERFGLDGLILLLETPRALKRKTKASLLGLYDWLARNVGPETGRPTDDTDATNPRSRLKRAPFLLTSSGHWVAPHDPQKQTRLVAYPSRTSIVEVHRTFSEDELAILDRFFELASAVRRRKDDGIDKMRGRVKEFLASLGVKKSLTPYYVILEVIATRLAEPRTSERRFDELLDYVRRNLRRFVSEARSGRWVTEEQVLRDLGTRLLARCFRMSAGRRGVTRVAVAEAYLPGRVGSPADMETLFGDVEGAAFLDRRYFSKRASASTLGWREFFMKLGAWSSPRLVPVPSRELAEGDYPWVERSYSSRKQRVADDFASPDIQAVVIRGIEEGPASVRLKMLFDSLREAWTRTYADRCSCSYSYHYYTWRSRPVPSTFLQFLRDTGWMKGSDGALHRPSELVAEGEANRLVLGDSVVYTSWEAPSRMLGDLQVKVRPAPEEAVARLKALRDGDTDQRNLLSVVVPVYRFLGDSLRREPSQAPVDPLRTFLKKTVEEEHLVYVPRPGRAWWPPSRCFWAELDGVFGPFREYLEPFFPPDLLGVMSSLGVQNRADYTQCERLLEELRELPRENLPQTKKLLPELFKYMSKLLGQLESSPPHASEVILLTEAGDWSPATSLVFEDDPKLGNIFRGSIPFAWAPVGLEAVKPLWKLWRLDSLSERVHIDKNLGTTRPTSEGVTRRVRELCAATAADLKRRTDPGVLAGRWGQRIASLGVFEADKVRIKYTLPRGRSRLQRTRNEPFFFSREENRLYMAPGTNPFDTQCASELSRIFDTYADHAFRVLDALAPAASDEGMWADKLDAYHLAGVDLSAGGAPDVAYFPAVAESSVLMREAVDDRSGARLPEASQARVPRLKDPATLVFGQKSVLSPYSATEGGALPKREVETKTPSGEPKPARANQLLGPTRQAVQLVGHTVVETIERREGRNPVSVAGQPGVGYDFVSSDRKIEVKDFQDEEPGSVTLTDYEWKAANHEKDAYWLYVVSGLREGAKTKVRAVQNPAEHLQPKSPEAVELPNWRSAIRERWESIE